MNLFSQPDLSGKERDWYFLEIEADRKNSGLPNAFLLNIFVNAAPKYENFKNYISILAFVNYRN